jgi:hypothetical protein
MPVTNQELSLADLARAFHALRPTDDAACMAIAQMLGFDWRPRAASGPARPGPPTIEPRTVSPPPIGGRAEIAPAESTLPPAATETERQPGRVVPSQLEPLPAQSTTWRVGVDALPAGGPEEDEPLPPFDPLFDPRTSRALMSTALSTDSGSGPLDLESTADLLATGKPVTQLPRLAWPTLSRGVQLLLDVSTAMMPFARDQEWLVQAMRRVVGLDGLRTLRFIGCPTRGAGQGVVDDWLPYQPPAAGTPILVCSDLGIMRTWTTPEFAESSEWLDFAERVRRAECPLIVLVPYPPGRWPPALARMLLCVQWDRATGVPLVRSLVGRAHRIRV